MTFSEILKENTRLKKELGESSFKVMVLSNIIVTQSQNILEYFFRKASINAEVSIGDYDNIVQDSIKFKNSNCVIIFWELSNTIDGLQYKIETFNDTEISQLVEKVKSDILFCLDALKSTQMVIFNKFSTLIFNHSNIRENRFDFFCNELNRFIESLNQKNLILINIDKIISKIGIDSSVDFRYFYSSKALYSIEFYKNYANFITPIVCSLNGKAKKALIFDCDNTLWRGILGEDGFDGIKMSAKTPEGIVFEEIQSIAIALSKKGIIIGLCSKNNFADVQNIIDSHPDMSLKNNHIVIKKINWDDKVSNLKAIAKELNIGLDSIVFVDDSDFEVNLIKEQLPMVTTLQVPKKLSVYPKMIRENIELFFNISISKDDLKRVEEYKNQSKREEIKESFSNIEDYLKSLEIKVIAHKNNKEHISRIAQLTQKTNQFNLTTKRYTEVDIEKFMQDGMVFSFEVSDKFGDSGLTGIVIIGLDSSVAMIDTFLMSCRIIGRNIEYAIFDYVVDELIANGISICNAVYIKTPKNMQVESLYDALGFRMLSCVDSIKRYDINLSSYNFKNLNYIGVENGTKD